MKPAYDQLGDEYKDSSSVLIGDSDCTASGKELCDANDVRGYPTIKYFTSETGPKGTDYSGPRDFDGLKVPTALPHTKTPHPRFSAAPPNPSTPPTPVTLPRQAWVEENLAVKCLLDNTEGCSDKEKEFMDKWKVRCPPRRTRSRSHPPVSPPFRLALSFPRPSLSPPLALPSSPTPNPPFPQAKGKEEVATQLDRLKGMSSGSMKPDLKK